MGGFASPTASAELRQQPLTKRRESGTSERRQEVRDRPARDECKRSAATQTRDGGRPFATENLRGTGENRLCHRLRRSGGQPASTSIARRRSPRFEPAFRRSSWTAQVYRSTGGRRHLCMIDDRMLRIAGSISFAITNPIRGERTCRSTMPYERNSRNSFRAC